MAAARGTSSSVIYMPMLIPRVSRRAMIIDRAIAPMVSRDQEPTLFIAVLVCFQTWLSRMLSR